MSRLAGFNYVFQIRRDKLLDLIQENVLLQGNSLVTPFRLSLQGPSAGLPPRRLNSVDLLVKSLDLALEVGTNFCDLTLHLEAGMIRLSGAPEAPIFGGSVNVRMQLVDGTLLLARPLEARLHAPSSPVTASIRNFASRANAEVNKLIEAERNQDFDLFPQPDLVKGLFLIFGHNRNISPEVFCAHVGDGNAADLTPIVDLKNPVALAISADLIRSTVPDANTFSRDPVTVTRVGLTFRDRVIDLDGEFEADEDCWSIDGGRFAQRLTPKLVGNQIVFIPDQPKPHLAYEVEVEFLCFLAVAIISLLQMAVLPIASLIGETLAQHLIHIMETAAGSLPDTSIKPQSVLAIEGVTWTEVAVFPEGLAVLGDRGGIVSPVQHPAIHIRTSNDPQNLRAVVESSVVVQAPTCAAQSFDYVESIQDDRYKLTVESELLFEPIDYVWTINGQALTSANEVRVIGIGGMFTLEYTGTVAMALPPPNGTAISGHSISLLYAATGPTLILNARNEDANYDIRVELHATDALGRVFTDAVNLTMVGDIATFGEDYDQYLSNCLKATDALVNKKGRQKGRVKPGEPQEQWQDLLDAMTHQVLLGNPEATAMIPGLVKALGVDVVGKSLAGKLKPKQV